MNDCVGMDEGAVGCVVLAGLSLPGKGLVCVDLDCPFSVYGLLWNLAAGAALIIAHSVLAEVRREPASWTCGLRPNPHTRDVINLVDGGGVAMTVAYGR